MNADDGTLIKRISSNIIRARQAECDGNAKRELQAHLWVLQDTAKLLLGVNDGSSEIDAKMAESYADSAYYTAERIRMLVALRVER